MEPFRTLPEAIDLVVACESCGHPVWNHYVTENGIESGSGDERRACRQFWIAGVSESPPPAKTQELKA